MFQYKILHDIVLTKDKLFKFQLANSDFCYLCLETKHDLKHMLVSCQAEFWEAFLDRYETHPQYGWSYQLLKSCIHGIIGNDHLIKLINHLLLLAKYYIFYCSINEDILSLTVVNKAEIEKQISISTKSPEY